jgi:hypothetical protein
MSERPLLPGDIPDQIAATTVGGRQFGEAGRLKF